jgi:glycosyltransferase involved in cell wall biosynthesis
MKVAILGPWTDVFTGGVERHVHHLAKSIAERNPEWEVHVISIFNHESDTRKRIKNLRIHMLKESVLPRTISGITTDAGKIIKMVKKIKPDVVHAHMIGAPYGHAAQRLANDFPVILTVHSLISHRKAAETSIPAKIHDKIWSYLEGIQLKKIRKIIAVSENLVPLLKRKGAQDVTVIPNGIDDEYFKGKLMDDKYVLFVGRVVRVKNLGTLIHACDMARTDLKIIGPCDDKNYLDELKSTASKNKHSNVFFSEKAVDDKKLLKYYRNCTAVALVSTYESNPIVLYEAMAVGKPIIASKAGGIPSIIEKEGILCNPYDPQEIAKAIQRFAKDKRFRENTVQFGKLKAMNFRWSICAEKTTALYKQSF